jgi:hypothetical protein
MQAALQKGDIASDRYAQMAIDAAEQPGELVAPVPVEGAMSNSRTQWLRATVPAEALRS